MIILNCIFLSYTFCHQGSVLHQDLLQELLQVPATSAVAWKHLHLPQQHLTILWQISSQRWRSPQRAFCLLFPKPRHSQPQHCKVNQHMPEGLELWVFASGLILDSISEEFKAMECIEQLFSIFFICIIYKLPFIEWGDVICLRSHIYLFSDELKLKASCFFLTGILCSSIYTMTPPTLRACIPAFIVYIEVYIFSVNRS